MNNMNYDEMVGYLYLNGFKYRGRRRTRTIKSFIYIDTFYNSKNNCVLYFESGNFKKVIYYYTDKYFDDFIDNLDSENHIFKAVFNKRGNNEFSKGSLILKVVNIPDIHGDIIYHLENKELYVEFLDQSSFEYSMQIPLNGKDALDYVRRFEVK